jgi:hypothetical protein
MSLFETLAEAFNPTRIYCKCKKPKREKIEDDIYRCELCNQQIQSVDDELDFSEAPDVIDQNWFNNHNR